MAAQAGSSGDLQHGRVAGLVPTALVVPGCQGYHDPQNGPKRPENPADDPNFDWNWEDRSCKQHKLLTDLDDQLSMRSLPPTPGEVYRLHQHFEGRKDLKRSIANLVLYFGQREVEHDAKRFCNS